MAIRTVLKYPNPRLRELCKPAGDDMAGLASLVQDMTDSMYAAEGAGLAAIQIGEPVCLFIVEASITGRNPQEPPMVFIDPEIIELGPQIIDDEEGCLSFPGIFVPVKRSLRCRTRARDIAGNSFEIEGEGLFARAMQHEMDHLNGRLLADYVGRIKRKMIERRLAREEAAEALG